MLMAYTRMTVWTDVVSDEVSDKHEMMGSCAS